MAKIIYEVKQNQNSYSAKTKTTMKKETWKTIIQVIVSIN